ncbi:MAG: DUF1844 domain-containing protein [Oligoflexales bacterium]|nr:DUF1844 domain-containing protein [Oligoflexales bacterium]
MDDNSIDFSGLILGFSSAALHYMGHSSIEGKNDQENLTLAQQNIRILELLSEKTRGNLNQEEEKLMKEVLLDLKIKLARQTKP